MRKNCKKKKSEDYMSVWKKRIAVEKGISEICGKNRAEVYGTGKAHAIWKCNDSFSETGRNILFGKRHIGRIRKILSS